MNLNLVQFCNRNVTIMVIVFALLTACSDSVTTQTMTGTSSRFETVTVTPVPQKTAEEHFDLGIDYLSTRQADLAIEAFTQAVTLDPQFSEAYIHRGLAYDQNHMRDTAIADFEQAIELGFDPQTAAAYVARGRANSIMDDDEGAIADFTEAIALDHSFVEAYARRGNVYAQGLGDFDLAFADFEQAIAINDQYALTYQRRGVAYALQNDLGVALEDLESAIDLDPADPQSFFIRGLIYRDLDSLSVAILNLTQAIELDPNAARYYFERGQSYGMSDQAREAIEDLSKALELGLEPAEELWALLSFWQLSSSFLASNPDLDTRPEASLTDAEKANAGEVPYSFAVTGHDVPGLPGCATPSFLEETESLQTHIFYDTFVMIEDDGEMIPFIKTGPDQYGFSFADSGIATKFLITFDVDGYTREIVFPDIDPDNTGQVDEFLCETKRATIIDSTAYFARTPTPTPAIVGDMKDYLIRDVDIRQVGYSPDSRLIIAIIWGDNPSVQVWEAESGRPIQVFENTKISGFDFSPDGALLMFDNVSEEEPFNSTGVIKLYNTATFQEQAAWTTCENCGGPRFSPDGSLLVAEAGEGGDLFDVFVWQVESQQIKYHVEDLTGRRLNSDISEFSADGSKFVIMTTTDVTIVDLENGGVSGWQIKEEPGLIRTAFSFDRSLLAIGTDVGEGGEITIREPLSGEILITLLGHQERTTKVVFSRDGSLLASHGRESNETYTIKLWDIATGELLHEIPNISEAVPVFDFSPEGNFLIAAFWEDYSIKIWDVTSGQVVRTLTGHTGQVKSISLSPDGSTFVSSSHDGTVRVWDLPE